MNRLGLIAALAVLSAAPALALAGVMDPAVPSTLPDSTIEPSGELRDSVPPRLIMNEKRAQHDADARQCLDLPTNRQIHRCAERYRAHVARAKAAKAAKAAASADMAKAPDTAKSAAAAKPAEITKPIESAKSGTVKPADTAKAPMTAQPVDTKATATATAKPADTAKSTTTAKPADAAKSSK